MMIQSHTATPRLLIADDDPAFLKAIATRLLAEGYDVVTRTNGFQALEYANAQRPDAIVLDINMPGGDGLSVLDRLRMLQHHHEIPVIYLTGDTSETLKTEVDALRPHALLYKPVDIRQLLESLWLAVGKPTAA